MQCVIEGQLEEIEADVLAEDRFDLSGGGGVEGLEEGLPLGGGGGGGEGGEEKEADDGEELDGLFGEGF